MRRWSANGGRIGDTMKFSEYKYERVDMEQLKSDFEKMLISFKEATSAKEQLEVFYQIDQTFAHVESIFGVCYVRFTLDTTDEFYVAEMDYVDESEPEINGLKSRLSQAMLESKFRAELEKELGSVLFMKAEIATKVYRDEIKEDLIKENKLVANYTKLISSADLEFQGQKYNLSQLRAFLTDDNREVRKEASELYYSFFEEHLEEIDDLYDQLVKVRTEIAKKLGFESFVELGYLRMRRMDYDKKMVETYRKQVLDYIVPVTNKLRKRQQTRLGLEKLNYYDIDYMFSSGNPKPQGDPEWIVAQGEKMYNELSKETGDFFQSMQEKELLDLVAKKGKSGGGYCIYIPDFKAPFVFSNFNGTEGDITVLTHEIGHAFQSHMSSNIKPVMAQDPTYDAAEIHSMSMEFLTYPWMESFFGDDVDKFKFMHTSDGLLFIPYGVLVDHFQHEVYEHPEMTPQMRRAKWAELEKMYLPYKDFSDNQFLKEGGFWMKQSHIFASPFYYIDYTLAQMCAYQFYVRSLENREEAWKDYVTLCSAGGTRPFVGLVQLANLKSPFEEGSLEKVVAVIDQQLEAIDDSRF